MSEEAVEQRKGKFAHLLDVVELLGNKLPHPFMLFVYLALFVIVLSWFVACSALLSKIRERGNKRRSGV